MSNIRQLYFNIAYKGGVFLAALCLAVLPRVLVAQFVIPNDTTATSAPTSVPTLTPVPMATATMSTTPASTFGQQPQAQPVYANTYGGMQTVPSSNFAQDTVQNTQQNTAQSTFQTTPPNVQQNTLQVGPTLYSPYSQPQSGQGSQFGQTIASPAVSPANALTNVPVMATQVPSGTTQIANSTEMNVPTFNPNVNVAGNNAVGNNAVGNNAVGNSVGNHGGSMSGVPNFIMPSENELPKLAFADGVGNAYAGSGQSGGTVSAFQPIGDQESPIAQSLNVPKRERSDDRRWADQQHIDVWQEIKDRKDPDVWRMRMPPYTGPLDNRTVGSPEEESDIMQVKYFDFRAKQDDYVYDWEKETPHVFDFSLLDPMRLNEQVKRWVGMGEDEGKARQHMEKALELMKREEYVKAAKEFEWAAYHWPNTVVEEDARYHAAECYYRVGRYYEATKEYTKLLSNFQSSQYKGESVKNMYGIARNWLEQVIEKKVSYVNVSDKSRPTFDTFGYAEKALKTIYTNCPNDPLADDSVYLLAHAYMRRGKVQGDASFEHAAEYFKQLRDHYPNSDHVVEAMRLEAICRQRASLGTAYATKHIDEAGNITDQLLDHRGPMLDSEKRNEILQLRNSITEEKAGSIWEIGKHYDDRKDYLSARLQYQKIVNEYPTTQYAEKARARLEQIRDYPDELSSNWERIKAELRMGK